MSAAEQYARWVLDPVNAIKTGRFIKLAAERFLSDLKRTDIYFDETESNQCIKFIEDYCLQWEGSWRGEPFILQSWQKFALQNIYGWIKANGKRRFTKVYIQIAKKNGKSSLSAGVSLFHLLADHRIKTPKVFTAANNEEQAKICVNIAGQIADVSDGIKENSEVRFFRYGENIVEVINDDKGARGNGFIKALSKEGSDKTSKTSGGKHGINASLGVVDEFGMSPDHGNSKTIDSSMVSRPERLMLYITTAGYNKAGPCYTELRASGIKVLDRVIEMDNYFVMLFEIDKPIVDEKEQDITIKWLIDNEDVWNQSNPNIDISVQRDALLDALKEALEYGGKQEVECLTLNFNVWVDSAEAFITAEKWNSNSHGINKEALIGQECFGGYEYISGDLMNSFCLFFPDVEGKKVILPIFWMPSGAKKHFDQANDWIKNGYVTEFAGDVPYNTEVFDLVYGEICKYQMVSFSYRPDLATNDLVQSLEKLGIQCHPLSHGPMGIGTPIAVWQEMILKGECEHFNNPVLTWMNSNCLAIRKGSSIRIEKSKSNVVGIYAGLNAVGEWKTIGKTPTLGILSL